MFELFVRHAFLDMGEKIHTLAAKTYTMVEKVISPARISVQKFALLISSG